MMDIIIEENPIHGWLIDCMCLWNQTALSCYNPFSCMQTTKYPNITNIRKRNKTSRLQGPIRQHYCPFHRFGNLIQINLAANYRKQMIVLCPKQDETWLLTSLLYSVIFNLQWEKAKTRFLHLISLPAEGSCTSVGQINTVVASKDLIVFDMITKNLDFAQSFSSLQQLFGSMDTGSFIIYIATM